jgi:squalene synthase HpnC
MQQLSRVASCDSFNAMSVGHYENFPVASWLMPARLRPAVRAIYRFARTADDLADEGVASPAERLSALDGLRAQLSAIELAEPSDWGDLAAAVREHRLQLPLFHDLLSAFSQDVVTVRYESFEQLTDYCRRSANPIGRLLVHLNDRATPEALAFSDAICSALQLINFWQDVAVDWNKGRVYLPQDELARFEVGEQDIAGASRSAAWRSLMTFQCDRARTMLNSGRPLTRILPGRMGLELRLILAGGNAILDKIAAVDGDVFRHRPILTKWDWLRRAPAALFA